MLTSRRLYTVLAALVPLAAALHVVYPLNRHVSIERPVCIARASGSVLYEIHSNSGWGHHKYSPIHPSVIGGYWAVIENVYYWVNMLLVIILPLVILVYLSASIASYFRRSTVRFSEQKRCVTNLTLATTFVHVLLELPAVGLYLAAAVKVRGACVHSGTNVQGAGIVHESSTMCNYQIVVHFLGVVEASIPFYTYLFYRWMREPFTNDNDCIAAATSANCPKRD
jgi:hypothetical protein